jgi:hypothetical protein
VTPSLPAGRLRRAIRSSARPRWASVASLRPRWLASRRSTFQAGKSERPEPIFSARASFSGGGGSRTRVRDWVLRSPYVRRTLLISPKAASDPPTPRPATWCLIPERGGTARGPARIIVASGTASGGQSKKRACKLEAYAASAMFELAAIKLPEV